MSYKSVADHLEIYEQKAGALYLSATATIAGYEPGHPHIHQTLVKLGAHMAALSKHTKASYLCGRMLVEKGEGLDITPTIANQVARRVMGRGLDKSTLLYFFGEHGRTAAHKSTVRPEDLTGLEALFKADLEKLISGMAKARKAVKKRYPVQSKATA